jgi:hypothetical protein
VNARRGVALAQSRRRVYDCIMISAEQIAAYRAMSAEQRWREVEALMDLAWASLLSLPHEERERRLALDRQQHDAADAIMLEYLRRFP